MSDDAHMLYRVLEVAPVTEETVERALNDRAREGWGFESIHFVMREGSHRPAMAYLFFTRVREHPKGQSEEAAARTGGATTLGRSPGAVDDHNA